MKSRSLVRSALRLVSFLLAFAGSSTALAESACVPQASGVPGIPGPPDWNVALPLPLAAPMIDDPRWKGAGRHSYPDILAGTVPDASVRMIHSGGSLYLQAEVYADPTPGTETDPGSGPIYWDSFYVAFANAGLTEIQVAKVGIDAAGGVHVIGWRKSAGAWSNLLNPAWLTASTGFPDTDVSGVPYNWTITLKIATGSIPGTKFWYSAMYKQSAVSSVEPYSFPSAGGFVQPATPSTATGAATWGTQFDLIGDPNGDSSTADSVWGDLLTYSGAPPAACAGLSVSDSAIGTTNTPSYKINTNAPNTFFAQLSTVGGAALPAAGAVKARFRIADCDASDWSDIPSATFADEVTNDEDGRFVVTCDEACRSFEANTEQCLLVELQAASGPAVFVEDSALRTLAVESDSDPGPAAQGGAPSAIDGHAGAAPGTAGATDGSTNDSDEDEGCSCSAAGAPQRSLGSLVAPAALLAWFLRAKRRRA